MMKFLDIVLSVLLLLVVFVVIPLYVLRDEIRCTLEFNKFRKRLHIGEKFVEKVLDDGGSFARIGYRYFLLNYIELLQHYRDTFQNLSAAEKERIDLQIKELLEESRM